MKTDDVVLGKDRHDDDDVFDDGGQYDRIYVGRLTNVVGPNMYFVIDSIDGKYEFGPAPSPHFHPPALPAPQVPPPGTLVAVTFADGNIKTPLVLTIYGWPS